MVVRFSGKIIAIFISLAIIVIASIIFVINIKNISVNKQKTLYLSINLMDTVRIWSNQNGFPHIVARSEHDMFFAIGYVHARQRLWQMDFSRRAGKGTLAEVLGNDALPFDLFIRSLNLDKTVADTRKILSKKTVSILESYSNGVNEYIASHRNSLSFEFGALGYEPEQWTIDDCIYISKMMAFELSLGFYYDVAFGEIAAAIGKNRAMDLIPDYPQNAPYVLDDAVKVRNYDIILQDNTETDSASVDESGQELSFMSGTADFFNQMREFIGIRGSSIGSNSWARRKDNSPNSPVVLANDPHLPLSLPARWIPMHATSNDFNAIGFMVPGIPLFIAGRNDDIAWGITNLMLDDCDFFIEHIDETGKYYIQPDSSLKEIEFVLDTIRIKNEPEHVYYKRFTANGQIISDAHIFNRNIRNLKLPADNKYLKGNALTYKWIGNEANDDILSMYKINTSKNWNEFTDATSSWSAPSLNFTYGDKNGNIGISPSGFLPIREERCNPNMPNNTLEKNTGWSGIERNNPFPNIYNPSKGFVSSANNKLASDLKHFVTNFWEPPSRAERIEELLLASDEYSARDAQYMQNDFLSIYAKQHFTYILPVFKKYSHLFENNEIEAYNALKEWDFIMTQNSTAAAIYNVFIERLLYNTFIDDLGDGYYYKYMLLSSMALRKLMEISADPHNKLFDDVRSAERERRDYIFVKSFKDAIIQLNEFFGTNEIAQWNWGQLHTLTLKHRFSDNKIMHPIVSVGPISIGGNSTTLNNTEHRLPDSYDVIIGASMRFIADMSENIVYISMPGGVSGDPLSPNYSNLVQIWLNGGYLKIPFDTEPSVGFDEIITLEPKL